MKILFLGNGSIDADNYPNVNSGGSVQTWSVSKKLVKKGHEIHIIRRSHKCSLLVQDGVIIHSVKFKGIESLFHKNSFMFHFFLLVSKFVFSLKSYSLINKINPNIICFIDRQTSFFNLKKKYLKVFVLHSPEALDFYKSYSILNNKLNIILYSIINFLQNKAFENSNLIVVLNNYHKEYLVKKGWKNVVLIPNGVDVEQYSLNTDNNYILYGGRFDWNKNVISLVQSFKEIKNKHNSYCLYLIGHGPKEQQIRKFIDDHNMQSKVKIISFLPRLEYLKFLKRCTVFILPSYFETNPVSILEAMAFGKPVISKKNMGTCSLIKHNYDGYLYSNNIQLQKYIDLILSNNDVRNNMGYNSRKKIEDNYNFNLIASKYERNFYDIMCKK